MEKRQLRFWDIWNMSFGFMGIQMGFALQNSNAFVLQLTCNDTSSSFLSETLECGAPYTLNGKVYTAAGTHIQRIPNTAGCDSTITFELIYTELNPEIIADSFSLKTNEGYSSYQWLKNGEPIADATESRLYISQSGHYQVIVTNEYGCTDTSEVYAITFPLAIDETAAIRSAIKIYPNPTQDKLCIQSPISINIVLTGIDGRILTTEKNATILSLKGYAEGVYFIRITDAEGKLIKTDKVIKK